MRKTKKLLIVLTLFGITFIACRKSIFDPAPDQEVTKKVNDFLVNYESSVGDSTLHFKLQVSKKGKFFDVLNEDVNIDLKGKKYLKTIYSTLQKKSLDNRYADLNVQQARELCLTIRNAIEETIKTLSPEQIKSPNIQGMYIGLSLARRILKNKLRKSTAETKVVAGKGFNVRMDLPEEPQPEEPETQPSYAQDVYEGYALGLSSFAFNEDIMVDRLGLLSIVNADAAALVQDDQGLYVFQYVLNNMPSSSFSLKDLLSQFDSYVAQHPENLGSGTGCLRGWWPSGSSHGCCGNYSGCCWYWHPGCYIHDKICTKCKPKLFCLTGCIPDPGASSVEPFNFIEDPVAIDLDSYLLPTPLPIDGIYYSTTGQEILANTPLLHTLIFFNSVDNKYYTTSSLTTLVSDGYYRSTHPTIGDIYYRIENGVSIMAYEF